MKKLILCYNLLLTVVASDAQQTFGGAGILNPSINYFMSYACAQGESVPDKSVYTELLSNALSSPMVDLEDVFKYVRSEMQMQTGQISEEHHTLLTRVNLRDKSKKKIAFLLGNQAYEPYGLQGPAKDVVKMHKALVDLGFEVQVFNNLAFEDKSKIDAFLQKAANYDIALFYYSGFGVETNGGIWICPTDVKRDKMDVSHYWNLTEICENFNKKLKKEVVKILIYDSCRTNPLRTSTTR